MSRSLKNILLYRDGVKECPGRGMGKEHPQAEYLKFKSWYLEYPLKDEVNDTETFLVKAAETFRIMKPFNDYLNKSACRFSDACKIRNI